MGANDRRLDDQIIRLKELSKEIKMIDMVMNKKEQIIALSEMLWVIHEMQIPELIKE